VREHIRQRLHLSRAISCLVEANLIRRRRSRQWFAMRSRRSGNKDKHRVLPPEARAGLMRAWLEILRQRHPGVVWVARQSEAETGRDATQQPFELSEGTPGERPWREPRQGEAERRHDPKRHRRRATATTNRRNRPRQRPTPAPAKAYTARAMSEQHRSDRGRGSASVFPGSEASSSGRFARSEHVVDRSRGA
jgi:hypothetical protein